MSQRARVMGLHRVIGYKRQRGSTFGQMIKQGATAYACDDCGQEYLVLAPLEPEHDDYSQCERCMPASRVAREANLLLARLIGIELREDG